MRRMSATPEILRRERHDAYRPTHPIIRQVSPKACAAAAIVLNYEEAHEKAGRRKGEQQT
jgi:hypothetical protein